MLIDDTYVSFVNLSERKDRLHHMTTELTRVGLPINRTPGLKPAEVMAVVPPFRLQVMLNRTPGAIGCHFSQVQVMQNALAAGQHAWVLEDDVVFCDDLGKRLDYLDKFCGEHPWDILWMGGTVHVNPPHWWAKREPFRDAELTDDPRLLRAFGSFCTYSYIVNRDSIDKVLGGLDHWLDRSMGIDWAMIMLQPTLFTYAFVPGCCKQYDNQSNIGTGITKFSNFKNLGPYWWARNMEDFDPTSWDWAEASKNGKVNKLYPMADTGINEPGRVFGSRHQRRAGRILRNYVDREQKKLRQR